MSTIFILKDIKIAVQICQEHLKKGESCVSRDNEKSWNLLKNTKQLNILALSGILDQL